MPNGLQVYAKAQARVESDREREYRLFALVTAKLERAAQLGAAEQPQDVAVLHDALSHNLELWTALLEDLVDPRNRLPVALKCGLVGLALWVQKRTPAVRAERAGFEELIQVNRQIMDGLAARPAAG